MSIHEKYRILKKLGEQRKRKFGEVFLVENKISGDKFVLKAARKSTGNQLICDQLRNEATMNFNFPGLPMVVEFAETENELLLLTKFQDGVTLDKYWNKLNRKERFPFLIRLLEKLEPILNHLWEQHIVHCDIKPSNILIDQNNGDIQVWLLDFGLAINQNHPSTRKLIFPLGYAAPELLLNVTKLVDRRADIFSIGISIWRLYANELPLSHPNPGVFTNLQLTHPIPEHDKVPVYVQNVIGKMCCKYHFKLPPNRLPEKDVQIKLARGISDRYASLSEVIRDLKKGFAENKRRWIFTR